MIKKLFENRSLSILLTGTAVLLLAALMLPLFAAAQAGDLPPRGGEPPTPTPPPPGETPPATAVPDANTGSGGGRLQLHVHYGTNWPWHLMAWQDLWTEVEWTDGENWFVVEGWRGQMDNIAQEDGQWVSLREWWVGGKDLNSGPFRWVIYDHEGGKELLTSDTFMLPAYSGATMSIDVTVGE